MKKNEENNVGLIISFEARTKENAVESISIDFFALVLSHFPKQKQVSSVNEAFLLPLLHRTRDVESPAPGAEKAHGQEALRCVWRTTSTAAISPFVFFFLLLAEEFHALSKIYELLCGTVSIELIHQQCSQNEARSADASKIDFISVFFDLNSQSILSHDNNLNSLPQRQPRRHRNAPRLRPVHEHRARRRCRRQDEAGHRDGGEVLNFDDFFFHFVIFSSSFSLDDDLSTSTPHAQQMKRKTSNRSSAAIRSWRSLLWNRSRIHEFLSSIEESNERKTCKTSKNDFFVSPSFIVVSSRSLSPFLAPPTRETTLLEWVFLFALKQVLQKGVGK